MSGLHACSNSLSALIFISAGLLFSVSVSAEEDSDGDGFSNIEEIALQTDPNDPADFPNFSVFNAAFIKHIIDKVPSEPIVIPEPEEPTFDAEAYYAENLEVQMVQNKCTACHISGGIAQNAKLLFNKGSGQASNNLKAISDYISLSNIDSADLLNKVRGVGHGGGTQILSSDPLYQKLEELLINLEGCTDCKSNIIPTGSFAGVVMASPRQILRKSNLLFNGRLPSEDEYQSFANADDLAKKQILIDSFDGEEFKQFLKTGANDKLLFRGLQNGIEFHILHGYTDYVHLFNTKKDILSKYENSEYDTGFLQWAFSYQKVIPGAIDEPLELIAHVVMNNKPYTEILTANYTMVTPYTNIVYNAGIDFGFDVLEELPNRVYDQDPSVFDYRIGVNKGQVNGGAKLIFENQVTDANDPNSGKITVDGEFITYPHAGILNSLAFLDRYPNTETNRNRARARWVYKHFLGVDIERSAPRSQKIEDLTDTNNPTMNNPACSVCHEIMDPVAGAYQNYAIRPSTYRSQQGKHSLPWNYLNPPDGSQSLFQEGDLWYRDMRPPSFNGQMLETPDIGVRWLGQKIADDDRFPKATVEFWWPAVMGQEIVNAPEEANDSDFNDKLAIYEAQQTSIKDIAQKFKTSNFNLKVMLAEMVMSPWFAATGLSEDILSPAKTAIGRGQLLTPEKISRKLRAIWGTSWGEIIESRNEPFKWDYLNDEWQYAAFIGTIDSFSMTERPRDFNVAMYNVIYKQAAELSGGFVARDLLVPDNDRHIFRGINVDTQPVSSSDKLIIKNKLAQLMFIFWGEEFNSDHPEFIRAYNLLESLYNHRKQNNIINLHSEAFSYYDKQNGGWRNPVEIEDCNCDPADDSTFMKGTWAGVVRYLMTHPNFIFE